MSLLKRIIEFVSKTDKQTRSATISPSTCYALLQNERRRQIIAHLATMDCKETDAGAIADHLSELGDERNCAYVSAIQQHLPRLSNAGVIEFNERTKSAKPRPELYCVYRVHQAVEETLC